MRKERTNSIDPRFLQRREQKLRQEGKLFVIVVVVWLEIQVDLKMLKLEKLKLLLKNVRILLLLIICSSLLLREIIIVIITIKL